MKDSLRQQFERLGMRLQELDARLADPAATNDMGRFRELSREQAEAAEIVELYRRFTRREADRTTAQEMLDAGDDDADMAAMARARRSSSPRSRARTWPRSSAPRARWSAA